MVCSRAVLLKCSRAQFEVFLDEHRSALNRCLDGLTEEQVRRSLVPSRTTLLGLVKHATFVEKVWFGEAHREACESSRRATSSLGLDDWVFAATSASPAPK